MHKLNFNNILQFKMYLHVKFILFKQSRFFILFF